MNGNNKYIKKGLEMTFNEYIQMNENKKPAGRRGKKVRFDNKVEGIEYYMKEIKTSLSEVNRKINMSYLSEAADAVKDPESYDIDNIYDNLVKVNNALANFFDI